MDGVNMDADTTPTKRVIVEDAEGLPTEKKTEIEEKVADALEENFDKHEMIAKAHNADNTEETEEDTTEDKMETDTEKTEEPGNLEQAWQMFDLAKVGKPLLLILLNLTISFCRLFMERPRTR